MNSRIFFHYTLVFAVLFASSFAVFHSSEHIAIGKIEPVIASFTEANEDYFHSESGHHDDEDLGSSVKNHSVESLCESCLLLTNMTAFGLGFTNLGVSPEKTKHKRFDLAHSKKHPFQTYLSRAPPSKA
jgi:hypothetical protein